jgi:serine/threonine protein kinase
LKSLTLIQSQQLINIIEYLYNCRIIHRDLRPDNLMLDLDQDHIKLIDFGFSTTYEINEMSKELPIEGSISYAGGKLLRHYYNLLLINSTTHSYDYERTFDLQCAINIMMCMTDNKINERMNLIKTVVSVERKLLRLQQLWIDLILENDNYSAILKLIEPLNQPPNFDAIKSEIENCLG